MLDEGTKMLKHKVSAQRVHREAASVVEVSVLPGGHCRLRVRAPRIAADAKPGDASGALMRPMSMTLPDEQAMHDVIAYIKTLAK